MSVLAAILHEQPKALRELVRHVPLELEEVIDLCLRKEPSKRLQSMADVKILLESLREKCDAGKLGQMHKAIAGIPREKVCLFGLAALREQGFVEFGRKRMRMISVAYALLFRHVARILAVLVP